MKKLKYFIPSFILMFLIFLFSQQTGEQSGNMSSGLILWIENIFHIYIPELLIRKIAHMSEYAMLCFSFIYGFHKSGFSFKQTLTLSVLCCFCYACSDEFHQLFIGGRAGQFIDVMIDTCGAIIASIFSYILKSCHQKK